MLPYIGLFILLLIAGLIVFIATRPEDYHIERTVSVSAPAHVVFPLINDLHNWARWSPFEKLDPAMKKTFEGPEQGVGAVTSWSGNSKAGAGRMTITESRPSELVSIKLQFIKPFAAICQSNFKIVPADGGSRVTWAMDGKNNFMAKAFHAFVNMDKMLGSQFDEGLANLNTAAQAEMQKMKQTTA